MFGPRLNSVFASRWKALWWSAGVLATAWCSVPHQDDADSDKTDQPAAHAQPAKHKNPWAK